MNSQSDAKYPIGIFLKLLVQRPHHYRSQNFKPFRTEGDDERPQPRTRPWSREDEI